MRELGIKAQYVKPYTVTTIDSDLCRLCISNKYYGLILKKNNCMGA